MKFSLMHAMTRKERDHALTHMRTNAHRESLSENGSERRYMKYLTLVRDALIQDMRLKPHARRFNDDEAKKSLTMTENQIAEHTMRMLHVAEYPDAGGWVKVTPQIHRGKVK